MPLFLRLLKHRRGNWISFVAIYALGLSVFLVVDGLSKNFQEELRLKSKELLEGELRISVRRPFTTNEESSLESQLPRGTRSATVWGFLSMLRVANVPAQDSLSALSKLVQVKAISPEYPLVGAFAFLGASKGKWSGHISDLRSGEILFPRELFLALHVQVGDSVKIGKKNFIIKDEFNRRPGGNFEFWEMGSRVYIPLADMAATGLEQKGSRIFRYRFYTLPPGTDSKALREKLETTLSDPEIEIESYTESGSDINRSFHMVTAFLKMLSLSAFLLSAVGGAFFFRNHLVGERRTVAIFATLGASRASIIRTYLAQNIFLSSLASAVGMLLARLWSQGLPILILRLYHVDLPSALPVSTLVLGIFLAIATSLLFGASSFAGLGRVPPATLLKPLDAPPLRAWSRIALFACQGLFFFAIAMWDSRSWMLSGLSVGSMGASFMLMGGLGWAGFSVLWMLRSRFSYAFRIILGSIRWGREKSLLAFATLGFVAFSLSLVPQLQSLILNEISVPKGRVIPQLFLFDIQEEQLKGLEDLIRSRGQELAQPSAMIRARLEKVNGQLFKRDSDAMSKVGRETLEDRNRRQFRNRGFNLSYRDTLSEAESVVEGAWWQERVKEGSIPEISVEKEFAKKLSLKLGDRLTFDVQGVEAEGRITSFRKVRWASFQPNFFVLFQPGALEEAPKTFLGTVKEIPFETAEDIQDRVSVAFPNVTLLNLKDVIGKMVETLDKLAWLVRFLSCFALIIGLTILWLIVDALVMENQRTIMLLRALGEPRVKLVRLFMVHYTGFCMAAGFMGYALSLSAAFVINLLVWQVPWTPDYRIFLICMGGSLVVGLFCAIYAAYRGAGQSLRGLLSLTRP